MRPYKTNSPQYLDYIAASLTRELIKADPRFCVLLENEYIKDNTELAIRWFEAKYGDYQAKYDFAEYLMCNGPEIDADTILHYREMALRDPVIVEISNTYLSNTETLVKLRKEKYGKDSDDCFNKPCFYMGRFSAAMGETGDIDVATSISSFLGSLFKKALQKAKPTVTAEENQRNGVSTENSASVVGTAANAAKNTANVVSTAATGKPVDGSDDKPQPAAVTLADGKPKQTPPTVGNLGPSSAQGVIPKPLLIGWSSLWGAIWNNNRALYENFTAERCLKALYEGAFGDWEGSALQKFLQMNSAANIKRRMGDCARLWRHVRLVRLFDTDNSFTQMTPDMKISGINANGMYTKLYGKSNPSAADVWSKLTDFNNTADSIRNASSGNTTTNNSSTTTTNNNSSSSTSTSTTTTTNNNSSTFASENGFSDTRVRQN